MQFPREPGALGRLTSAWCLLLWLQAPAPADDPPQPEHYELVEDWSVAAQGPVHLREKRVTATYRIDVSEQNQPSGSDRTLHVRFVDAAVNAGIPAQRRSGNFDSRKPPGKLVVEHHELIRPLSLWQQTLNLQYTPDRELQAVTGDGAVLGRLDDLYDEHLRGSEQDLYTRAFERERLGADALRRSWAALLLVPARELLPTPIPRERETDVEFIACIPSESWMTTVALPLKESINVAPAPDGTFTITQSASLSRIDTVETTIGDTPWKYTPQTADRTVTLRVQPDGRVVSLSSSARTVLQTILSLGNDVPITMTIEHAHELSRR
jgi:hypothetical protein